MEPQIHPCCAYRALMLAQCSCGRMRDIAALFPRKVQDEDLGTVPMEERVT